MILACPSCHHRVRAFRCPHCGATVYEPTAKQQYRFARNRAIREERERGASYKSLAVSYKLNPQRISQICREVEVHPHEPKRGNRVIISARVTRSQRRLLLRLGKGNISTGVDVALKLWEEQHA